MDGRNSSGRKVSLLNDSCAAPAPAFAPAAAPAARTSCHLPPVKLPSLAAHSATTRSPSSNSTPSLSPRTPPLIRSESTDSRAYGSPSPLTPQSGSFEHPAHLSHKQAPQLQHQNSYYTYRPTWTHRMDDPTLFPIIPENTTITGFPLPPVSHQAPVAPMRTSHSPVSESHVSNASVASAAKPAPKKNQYPCPLAKQYQCNDFFTTSGHAARHAKKHTGRKDAICPECNKAFTRKDNMEQHRRTHQNVRGPSKNVENRVKKSKQSSRKADKAVSNPPFEAAVNAQLEEQQQQQRQQHQHQQQQHQQLQMPLPDPSHFALPTDPNLQPAMLPAGGGPYFMSAEPIGALPQPITADYGGRPQLYRPNYTNTLDFTTVPPMQQNLQDPELHFSYPSPGLSNGLNTLALAASGHRRLSEHDRPEAQRRSSEEASSTKSASNTP